MRNSRKNIEKKLLNFNAYPTGALPLPKAVLISTEKARTKNMDNKVTVQKVKTEDSLMAQGI
ncbi:hypothetical protein [Lactococcus garvieae]|uniref:Uncharacterized protein n=1 Tax=Lactococcus garvieae TaxID=1363 RepID=A0AA46YRA5_9LACT|nr:hypothetical protein [Lactococcus garvieae]UYT10302.1 hypothetical protein OF801_10220 [Lactococcus garvieae]UYT12369.1 hypothetical protein OF800_10355 [Lactococcus garvieae]